MLKLRLWFVVRRAGAVHRRDDYRQTLVALGALVLPPLPDLDHLVRHRLQLPGLLPMPFNRTGVKNLYCVGDSCFPGQGLNAVAFSGFACAQRVGADLGLNPWALPA